MRTLWRWLRILLMSVGAPVLLTTCTPVVYWWATALAGPWNDPSGELLIVLGGGLERDGFLAQDTLRRTLYALLAWREGGFRKVVVCGGKAKGQVRTTAEVMRDYLVFSGVPPAAIQLENESHSTRENALFAARLLESEPGRKVLLTSDAHMFRARRVFTRVGVSVEPRPIPDVRSRSGRIALRWALTMELLMETAKIIHYKLHGWM